MLKAQRALATGHFFNHLGHVGVVTPPPPKVTSKDAQVRMWTTGTCYILNMACDASFLKHYHTPVIHFGTLHFKNEETLFYSAGSISRYSRVHQVNIMSTLGIP